MAVDDERRVFEQSLWASYSSGHGWPPDLEKMAKALAGEGASLIDLHDLGVEVVSFQRRGEAWHFRLRARAQLNDTCRSEDFEGECRFAEPVLVPGSVSLRRRKPVRPPGGTKSSRWLAAWALAVGVLLPVFTVGGGAAVVFSLLWALDGEAIDPLQLLVVAASVGWLASCGAALRSFMERYRNGREYDDEDGRRISWPDREGTVERFSTLMAPTFLLRPLLGATIAPIAYLALRLGASAIFAEPVDQDVRAADLFGVMAVAGLAGMFSKSIWDNLNERAQNLFKP